MGEIPIHYVCTRAQAREMAERQKRFWVSNCGCREGKESEEGGEGCKRSRIDVCLIFSEFDKGSGTGLHEVSREFAEGVFHEAEEKHLVTRPFRNPEDPSVTDGICFCCDDCCGYFKDENEKCDKGTHIEKTDLDSCTNCGECVSVCYFRARETSSEKLIIDRSRCYGCGLCLDVCPQECIEMVERE